MTEIICGKCGEKFQSETEQDSDEYCPTCIKEMNQPQYPYPEHEKLQKVIDQSQTIGEFFEWLKNTKKIVMAQWGKWDSLYPLSLPTQETLAEYFEIDLNKLEQEKRAMLEELRQHNSPV